MSAGYAKQFIVHLGFWFCVASAAEPLNGAELAPAKKTGAIRVATFNVSLHRAEAGKLTRDLQNKNHAQAKALATVIRHVQPDILLLNEIDDSTGVDNAALFHDNFLANIEPDLLGGGAWSMPYRFVAPVNTGEPSGLDLNGDGRSDGPEDAWGFGVFPGQYGMAVLSRFEIDGPSTRTFQKLLWSDLPGALEPVIPASKEKYYSPEVWKQLRLPSKSLWDVVVRTPLGPLHLLASHPTPPVFDGPEDRNGCRNHDEIRLLVEYIDGSPIQPASGTRPKFWSDDQGRTGALAPESLFVVAGDLNCDPKDGDARRQSLEKLLSHSRVRSEPVPTSQGAAEAAQLQGGKNVSHQGDPSHDTGDFNDRTVGNLRIDYVLPCVGFQIVGSGVVWPTISNPSADNLPVLKKLDQASDHHLVWVDLELAP